MTRRPYETNWHEHPAVPTGEELTFGERAADAMRRGMGSWPFVFAFFAIMIAWAIANSVFYLAGTHGKHGFDPYPYILLNLFLSMLAGVQAAALLIAAKRSDAIASALAQHDYETDQAAKAELDNQSTMLNNQTKLLNQVHANTGAIRTLSEALHQHLVTDQTNP